MRWRRLVRHHSKYSLNGEGERLTLNAMAPHQVESEVAAAGPSGLMHGASAEREQKAAEREREQARARARSLAEEAQQVRELWGQRRA